MPHALENMRLDAYTVSNADSTIAERSGTILVGDGANVLCGIRNRHPRVLGSESHIAFSGNVCFGANDDKRVAV